MTEVSYSHDRNFLFIHGLDDASVDERIRISSSFCDCDLGIGYTPKLKMQADPKELFPDIAEFFDFIQKEKKIRKLDKETENSEREIIELFKSHIMAIIFRSEEDAKFVFEIVAVD